MPEPQERGERRVPREGGSAGLPLWVWIVLALAFLWAGFWYLGLSLPTHWRGVPR